MQLKHSAESDERKGKEGKGGGGKEGVRVGEEKERQKVGEEDKSEGRGRMRRKGAGKKRNISNLNFTTQKNMFGYPLEEYGRAVVDRHHRSSYHQPNIAQIIYKHIFRSSTTDATTPTPQLTW